MKFDPFPQFRLRFQYGLEHSRFLNPISLLNLCIQAKLPINSIDWISLIIFWHRQKSSLAKPFILLFVSSSFSQLQCAVCNALQCIVCTALQSAVLCVQYKCSQLALLAVTAQFQPNSFLHLTVGNQSLAFIGTYKAVGTALRWWSRHCTSNPRRRCADLTSRIVFLLSELKSAYLYTRRGRPR